MPHMKPRLLTMMLMLLLLPCAASAQWSFDVPSIEAYIKDHKDQRSLLLARATLEQGNALLHDYSSTAAGDYREIGDELDRYTRAFDVIDLLYETVHASISAYDTYETVHRRLQDYRQMLSLYSEKCMERGDIVSTDTLIISVNRKMIERVAAGAGDILSSFSGLVLFATGAAPCTTATLLRTVEDIDASLDEMRRHINAAYFETWKYIQVRTGYWKASVYRAKSMEEILEGAFSRWRASARPGD